jgi:hypothetical protein
MTRTHHLEVKMDELETKVRAVIEKLVAAGKVEVITKENGETYFRLTKSMVIVTKMPK